MRSLAYAINCMEERAITTIVSIEQPPPVRHEISSRWQRAPDRPRATAKTPHSSLQRHNRPGTLRPQRGPTGLHRARPNSATSGINRTAQPLRRRAHATHTRQRTYQRWQQQLARSRPMPRGQARLTRPTGQARIALGQTAHQAHGTVITPTSQALEAPSRTHHRPAWCAISSRRFTRSNLWHWCPEVPDPWHTRAQRSNLQAVSWAPECGLVGGVLASPREPSKLERQRAKVQGQPCNIEVPSTAAW